MEGTPPALPLSSVLLTLGRRADPLSRQANAKRHEERVKTAEAQLEERTAELKSTSEAKSALEVGAGRGTPLDAPWDPTLSGGGRLDAP